LNEPLNILITHLCSERLADIADALAAGDRQAARCTIEGAYLAVRDDLGQYAAPEWLDQARSPSTLIHAVCVRIADGMQQLANANAESARLMRDATVQAVACLCLDMDEDEEAQLGRTLIAMRRHARSAEEIAGRLSECPALAGSSPHLGRAVRACVSDRIGDFASVLMPGHGGSASDIASRILQACPPSVVQQGDLTLLDLDGRRDRRGIDLAAGIVKLCIEASAHALGTAAPGGLRATSTRMAATALAGEPALEMRFRARLLAVGQTAGGEAG